MAGPDRPALMMSKPGVIRDMVWFFVWTQQANGNLSKGAAVLDKP